MKITTTTTLILVALLCCSCEFNGGNGLIIYKSGESNLGYYKEVQYDAKGKPVSATTTLGTKGLPQVKTKTDEITVRDILIARLRKGDRIDDIAKSIGIDADALREMIK